jgi:hypothetical protein
LLNSDGEAVTEIVVSPTFTIEQKITDETVRRQLLASKKAMSAFNLMPILAFTSKKQQISEDLVPIRIQLTNNGEKVAEGIFINLLFQDNCKLIEEELPVWYVSPSPRNIYGLSIEDEEHSICSAQVGRLSNDRTISSFSPIYVRFSQHEAEYLVYAEVTQDNFPRKIFTFKIKVVPKYKEIQVL